MFKDTVVGFMGGGNMARAIAEGILKNGLINNTEIIVSCVSPETRQKWAPLQVLTTHSNAEVVNVADIIILAVKPHQLEAALKTIPSAINENLSSKLFVSVIAGITCKSLYSELKTYVQLSPRLIRVMPNTLVTICAGCSAISPHESANQEDIKIVREIFGALGICEIVSEALMSAVTGVSGSGPAYIYTIIEGLSDGGVKQGLPRNLATQFAAQTVFGAAKMILESKKHPAQLKDEVCSAGGTTIHALHALEKGNIRATLISAVEAAAKRGDEIGKLSQK